MPYKNISTRSNFEEVRFFFLNQNTIKVRLESFNYYKN